MLGLGLNKPSGNVVQLLPIDDISISTLFSTPEIQSDQTLSITDAITGAEISVNDGVYLDFDGTDDTLDIPEQTFKSVFCAVKPDSTDEPIMEVSTGETVSIASGDISTTNFSSADEFQTTNGDWEFLSVSQSSEITGTITLGEVSSSFFDGGAYNLIFLPCELTEAGHDWLVANPNATRSEIEAYFSITTGTAGIFNMCEGAGDFVIDLGKDLGSCELTNGDFSTGDTTGWAFEDCTGTVGTYKGKDNVCEIELTNGATIYPQNEDSLTIGELYYVSGEYYRESTDNIGYISVRVGSAGSSGVFGFDGEDAWKSEVGIEGCTIDTDLTLYSASGDVGDKYWVNYMRAKKIQTGKISGATRQT